MSAKNSQRDLDELSVKFIFFYIKKKRDKFLNYKDSCKPKINYYRLWIYNWLI